MFSIFLVTGSAGCLENHNPFRPSTNISAFRSDDYGYGRMKVFNSTHLHFEQVSIDKVRCLYIYYFHDRKLFFYPKK